MKTEYNFLNDRRYKLRRPYKAKVSLHLNELIKGDGYTIDISIDGVRIRSLELFAFLRAGQAENLVNHTVEVSFISEALTLHGTIIRVNADKHELAIRISQISDPPIWISLCKPWA
jgi:PilZ domain